MHPAFSILLFTVASGAGYGLLALYGVLLALGVATIPLGLAAILLALALVSFGLLSSTAHLGHKERAWRALSQWRSSWLSREGVAALASYGPALALLLALWAEAGAGLLAVLGILVAVLAAVTVYCTAMIYRSLKPIPQWHNRHTVPAYLALALATGALWLDALAGLVGAPSRAAALAALLGLALAALAKHTYWRFIDGAQSGLTIEAATGLGRGKQVRLLDPPHSDSNYLMKEMGFRIARKHAERLRLLFRIAGLGIPAILTLPSLVLEGPLAAIAALAAALLATAGTLAERWLFFAEAKHTVQLYYGQKNV
jgi:DMSO reductase anchor subunit